MPAVAIAPPRFWLRAAALTCGMTVLLAGCASRVVDVTDPPPQAERRATADAAYGRGDSAPPGADYPPAYAQPYPSSRSGDPRAVRTADGRPAPYGRDPETGRAINDAPPLPPPAPTRLPPAGRPLPQPSAAGVRAPARGEVTSVVVAKGDTLHSLARRHSVKVEDIKRLNGLGSDQIKIGQRLSIPGA